MLIDLSREDLSSEDLQEGSKRTSLDQFRPLLNTNQISPVYDKLGLNLVWLMGFLPPSPPRSAHLPPPRLAPLL